MCGGYYEEEFDMKEVKAYIRSVPDFPIEGIDFKDITSLCNDPVGFNIACKSFLSMAAHFDAGAVVAIESRGFIFGSIVARELSIPLILARKPGKLPNDTVSKTYDLEYGTATLEIQTCEPLSSSSKVIVIDDLIATGGTAIACADLINENFNLPPENIKVCAVIDLPNVGGSKKIQEKGYATESIVTYE